MPIFLKPVVKKDTLQVAPGLYYYQRESASTKSRIHLRVDSDSFGILMINANRVIHLNPTATQMAYMILQEIPKNKALHFFTRHFRVPPKKAEEDFNLIQYQLNEIINENGKCPICDLQIDTTLPFSARPSAPYRMDLAITYRCNNACSHCYNARPRNFHELESNSWKKIIDLIWDLKIPHVVFTGGEPTLREDLAELIAYAQNKGLITGINTNGRKLANSEYLNTLISAGLDHVQITFESMKPEIHDKMVNFQGAWAETVSGIRNVIKSNLYMMTNTTLLTTNKEELQSTLEFLGQERVPTVGLNALIYAGHGKNVATGIPEEQLPPLLELANKITLRNDQRLIWYTPTQYCHFNPLDLKLGIKGCTAALYNMCIEPNGDVLPCQSYYFALGNILNNEWSEIWDHPLAISLRERQNVPEGCKSCDLFVECGGGCPLARSHQKIQPVHLDVFQ